MASSTGGKSKNFETKKEFHPLQVKQDKFQHFSKLVEIDFWRKTDIMEGVDLSLDNLYFSFSLIRKIMTTVLIVGTSFIL